jgi:hypothetical protein
MLLRWKNTLLLAAVLLVINLPELHSLSQDHTLSANGVDVRAQVVPNQDRKIGDDYFLTFQIPKDTPEKGDKSFKGTARVDAHTYDVATGSGEVIVRVLPGSTTNWSIDGQIKSSLGLVITIMADAFLLIISLLLFRFGSRLRAELVLLAEEDLERCPPGSVLDRIAGQRYVVCGEVHTIEDDAIVLELGDRRVRVLLDGHHNPAGYQQPVRATGTMIA